MKLLIFLTAYAPTMILIVLLVIPILFWLIPFVQLRQQEQGEMRLFLINFIAMLLSSLVIGILLWQLKMYLTTIIIVLFAISAAWVVLFHLLRKR